MTRAPARASGSEEAYPVSIPAPTGGWNASDQIANMPASDAVFLDNLFPEASDVRLRKGYVLQATLPADTPTSLHNIRTLVGYSPPSGGARVFAGCGDGFYEVTTGAVATTNVSAATNGEWQYTSITTAGGSYVWLCNGVDSCKTFNGTAWTNPSLSGVTSSTIANVTLFKRRLVFCITGSLSFFYLDTNSISGTVTEFPLGALFPKGGYLMATAAWTLDGGDGSDDYFVALTSEGEVAVYRGTDPSSDVTWALVGTYFIGKPLNRRCFAKLGGDVAVITNGGLQLLSKALISASVNRVVALTQKIHKAYTDYVSLYKGLFGWQLVVFPEGPFVLLNVPILNQPSGNFIYSYQFVMNSTTKAWCRFLAMNAEVWLAFNGKLYFAANNLVYEAWAGNNDNGKGITGKGKTAFSYLRSGGHSKSISMIRPLITADASVNFQLGIDTDYSNGTTYSAGASYTQSTAAWDSAIWDQAAFASSAAGVASWKTVPSKPGWAVSVRLRITAKNVNMTWNATDLLVKRGGLL